MSIVSKAGELVSELTSKEGKSFYMQMLDAVGIKSDFYSGRISEPTEFDQKFGQLWNLITQNPTGEKEINGGKYKFLLNGKAEYLAYIVSSTQEPMIRVRTLVDDVPELHGLAIEVNKEEEEDAPF